MRPHLQSSKSYACEKKLLLLVKERAISTLCLAV